MSQAFFLRPSSALVFRSGRPFGAGESGGQDAGHEFPLPGTVAGALRAAWYDLDGRPVASADLRNDSMHLGVRGPIRCTRRHDKLTLWLQRPGDLAAVRRDGTQEIIRLQPDAAGAHACDLPFGLHPLVSPHEPGQLEDADRLPAWCELNWLLQWMSRGVDRNPPKLQDTHRRVRLPADRRTHAKLDADTLRVDEDGGLHQSSGLEFLTAASEATTEQGLLVWAETARPATQTTLSRLHLRHARLGADGRTCVFLSEPQWDSGPAAALSGHGDLAKEIDAVVPGQHVRLLLLTPACYLRNGWYPDGLKPVTRADVAGEPQVRIEGSLVGLADWKFRLVAAAVGRGIAHSTVATSALPNTRHRARQRGGTGAWQDRISALHRLVPAGSVYWLEVLQMGAEPLSKRQWQPTCRFEFARDGHGLGLFGIA